jgi:hypothetical protein
MSMDVIRRLQGRMQDHLPEVMPLADFNQWNQPILLLPDSQYFTVGLFRLGLGPNPSIPSSFTLEAPTAATTRCMSLGHVS